ncbi:MAG: lysophospholipid acyltransferase family protein [Planctomycetota bacterium]
MEDFDLRPARDLGLRPDDRARSLRREPGLREVCLCHIWWGLARVYLKLYHRLTIRGRRHLPSGPPFVLVANHTSHLDTLMLASALPVRHRRYVFPISAGDVFFETRLAARFSSVFLNALPMWRHRAGRHELGELRERITAGDAGFILFPEGTRSPDGRMQPFLPGVGMLLAGTDVPVVPCGLTGAFAGLPRGATRPRPVRLRVRVGRPMRFDRIANRRAGWEHVAGDLERRVRCLTRPGS